MKFKILMLLFISTLVTGCGGVPYNPAKLPANLTLDDSVLLPSDLELAVYVPESLRSSSYRNNSTQEIVNYGAALERGFLEVGANFFDNILFTEDNLHKNYGLLLDIDPHWDIVNGNVQLKLNYQVINSDQEVVHISSQQFEEKFNYLTIENSFYNAAVRASQLMFVDIINKLSPSATSYPASAKIGDIPPETLVNLDEPIRRTTGFKLNSSGELMTTAHAIDNCLVAKASIDDRLINVVAFEQSSLLDLAVLSTGQNFSSNIVFDQDGTLELGEPIVSVSFPRDGSKKAAPLLSFGNVNSKEGISGSMGAYQVSSAVAPDSKGGPLLNSESKLIGMVNGHLNLEYLSENGFIPKNVFFGFKAEYIKKFLESNGIEYEASSRQISTNTTETALAETVQINCYQ